MTMCLRRKTEILKIEFLVIITEGGNWQPSGGEVLKYETPITGPCTVTGPISRLNRQKSHLYIHFYVGLYNFFLSFVVQFCILRFSRAEFLMLNIPTRTS